MLNQGQQTALDKFMDFLADPDEEVFILEGPAGTGKSFLVQQILDTIPTQTRAMKLINPSYRGFDIYVTATTNKAVEALKTFVEQAGTIHSLLGLMVNKDLITGGTDLQVKRGQPILHNGIIFIDEASFIDNKLLNLIFKMTSGCKYVFIGDPYQLTPVKANHCPAFALDGVRAQLTEIVRNKGNQIEEVSKLLKQAVITGTLEKFKPDGKSIFLLNEEEFNKKIEEEFTKPDWNESKAKIIAWTNKAALAYGQFVNSLLHGSQHFIKGNYATVNQYIKKGDASFYTDETVLITDIEPAVDRTLAGYYVQLNGHATFFLPEDWKEANKLIKQHREEGNYVILMDIEASWIDLRPAPACTINKSQGSTYEKVFIDYDDILKCRQRDQLYRLLYVATSRAKTHVFFKRS